MEVKSGRDLNKSPELSPKNVKKISHYLLISD